MVRMHQCLQKRKWKVGPPKKLEKYARFYQGFMPLGEEYSGGSRDRLAG